MPEELILTKIRQVRSRLTVQRYFQTLAQFLFYGSLACLPVLVIDSLTAFNIPQGTLLWAALGIALIALVVRLIRPVSLYDAARSIDMGASLKDRVVSGLEQIQHQNDETLTPLQLRDTSSKLQAVPVAKVARYTVPRETKYVLPIAVFLVTLSFIEFFAPPAISTEIDFSPQIAAEAEPLLKQITEAKKEAERDEDQELKEILNQIEERALELKKPQIAPKEALARMTELSALLKTKIDPEKMARQEESMRGLGQQFVGNPYLGEFGQQLKRGDYQQAASDLDKVAKTVPKIDKEKRQNISDALKRGGKGLQNTDFGGLGSELSGAGEALDAGDSEGTQTRLSRSSRRIRNFGLLKKRNWRLAKLLSECQACKAGIAGVCKSAGLTYAQSTSPNNNAGKATSANQPGQLTSLDAALNLTRITGVQSEGESAVQTVVSSPEGQQSSVSYKEAYTKYQKLSEDALTQEQIPLGYKFYVKRYFESIKPSDE
ncbi:MAG: hypothetical protein OXN17_22570 [Candidatus Poribacteria bacterium]|nr:hypothetical protein [Candidatus Poribacteria bacterium]MDE0504193.1 hypothetical protein [Candidatus Poribacteria bacterium]